MTRPQLAWLALALIFALLLGAWAMHVWPHVDDFRPSVLR